MNYKIRTLAQHPGYAEKLAPLHRQAGPRFLSHADDYHWSALTERFADFQLLALSGGELIGAALALPLHWNGAAESLPPTIEEIFIRAIGCRELKKPANTLAALAIVTTDRYRGNGLRPEILKALKRQAGEQGFASLVAPVRPTQKSEHPLAPFAQYVNWKQTDGSPFDPELRMHWGMGASMLDIMPRAVTLEASVDEWARWTDMHFTQSGEYIVEGAQKPIIIDHSNNCGYYADAHLWMLHKP